VSDEAVRGFGLALESVARVMDEEFARHRAGTSVRAFDIEVVGPIAPERLPPVDAPGPGVADRLLHAFALWRATRAVHAAASGFNPESWNVRIYVIAAAQAAHFAEGSGEAGGDVGVVRAGLDGEPLLAATAVMHEVLHTLGATDKYDAAGHAREPHGLVEPELAPRWPQHKAEIMVGEIPLGPDTGRLPECAQDIGVGILTAEEIGWRRAR
jgi:hypothetical protein